MNRDSINEMEQIQIGLEQFLQQEVKGYKESSGSESQTSLPSGSSVPAGENPRELQLDFLSQDDNNGNISKVHNGKVHNAKVHNGKIQNDKEKNSKVLGSRNRVYDSQEMPEGFDYDEEADRENNVRKGSRTDNNTSKKKKKRQQEDARQKSSSKGRKADQNKEYHPPKREKKKKRRIKRFLFTILFLILMLSGLWYWMIGSLYGKMNYKEVEALAGEPMKEDGVTNILLIGNDSRSQGEDGRSDAMILLSISNKTKTIHMTSLLRDMYVEIPGYKGNRLNAAYSYGGAKLLMETVEQNLGISVNRYMLVNFQAFAGLIDAVGGVELELTNEEVAYINGYLVEYNILLGRAEGTDYLDESLSGMVQLNGPQALAFSRNRFLGTDFGRTERQRKILTAAMKKVPMALLTGPKKLTDGLLPNLTTNLSKGECLQLSLMGGKLLTYEIVAGSIPVEGSYKNKNIRGMAVLEVDFEKNKEYIRTHIYGK